MEKERRRIKRNAGSCMKQSEYIRQRALGFAPKSVLPDAFYYSCEKLDVMCEKLFSAEVNATALKTTSRDRIFAC